MSTTFSFTRNPSVKVAVDVEVAGLVAADNQLILIGPIGAVAGTAAINSHIGIDNFGDPVAAIAECNYKFGVGSVLGQMVVAAIRGVLYSNLSTKLFPPIVCIPVAAAAGSAEYAAALAANLTLPMPYVAFGSAASDAGIVLAVKSHMNAISGNDRGDNGQFGSFAFLGADGDTSSTTPIGIGAASENMYFPWLRDSATTKANHPYEVASAVAALAAAEGIPFNPLNGVIVGGLMAPSLTSDYHTPGDAGTVALGLAAGLIPLTVSAGGDVQISRTVSSRRIVSSTEDIAYYDLQDWQVLYYLRKNAYVLAQQPRYKQAKASIQKLQALKSELIKVCKDMESDGMLQHVDLLAGQFTVERSLTNRHAAKYVVPVNVIPGFHNKGIALVAGVQFDVVVA